MSAATSPPAIALETRPDVSVSAEEVVALERGPGGFQPGLHGFACLTAGATLLLICAGALVTSTDSGLAVPDWPLAYGMVFPPMVGGILFEHSHRLIASLVGAMIVILCGWLWRKEPRTHVKRLGFLALAAVLVQGGLGGLTVIFLLPEVISIAHACLAQAFFCLVIVIAFLTSREWHEPYEQRSVGAAAGIHALTLATVAAVYVQLILGATVRHFDAALAIPDFPLMLGRVIPPLQDPKVIVHFAHRMGALVVACAVLATAYRVWKHFADDPRLNGLATLIAMVVALQIGLGALTVLSKTAVVPTSMHVATGAFLLGSCVALALRVHRYVRKANAV